MYKNFLIPTIFLCLICQGSFAAPKKALNDGEKLYAEGKKLLERGAREAQFETVSNAIDYLRKARDEGVECRLELGKALYLEDLLWNRHNQKLVPDNESFLLNYKNRTRVGVLLLHALGTTPLEMRELGELLHQKGFTVYAPRLAGHGTSPTALGEIGPTEWRKDYLLGYNILNLLCDRVYVIGSGLGGVLALELAEKEELGGVITLNAPLELQGFGRYLLFLTQFSGLSQKRDYPEDIRPYSYQRIPLKTCNQVYNVAAYVTSRLSEISEPVIIFQSYNDPLVKPISADIIHDNVKSRQKRIYWLNNAPHYLLSKSNPCRQLTIFEILRFITQ